MKNNQIIETVEFDSGNSKIDLYSDKIRIESPQALPGNVSLTPETDITLTGKELMFSKSGRIIIKNENGYKLAAKYSLYDDTKPLEAFITVFNDHLTSLFSNHPTHSIDYDNPNLRVEIQIPEHVIIEANANGVVITRKGIRSFANRGSNGAQSIPYSAIIGTDFKKSSGPIGVMGGHISFNTAAGNQTTSGLGVLYGSGSDYAKANTVVFRDHDDEMEEIKNIVEYKINQQSKPTTAPLSSADEIRKYKQLLDDGVITQEEFDAKKKQLLGL